MVLFNQIMMAIKQAISIKIAAGANTSKLIFVVAYVVKLEEDKAGQELVHIPVELPDAALRQHAHDAPNQSTPPGHENIDAFVAGTPLQLSIHIFSDIEVIFVEVLKQFPLLQVYPNESVEQVLHDV